MKIGVLLHNFGGFPETNRGARACIDLALEAERLGFDSVWVTDHVVLPVERVTPYPHDDSGVFPYSWQQEIFEPITLMAALAQATARVEIGVAVLVVPYRHPLFVAKALATADQLSDGRIVLGAGVGWLREEFEALGLPAEIFERRGAVTLDYLEAMRTAWTAEAGASHEGPFVRFEGIGARPQPQRRPHPPIWIGGQGDRALRRAARIGDGYLAISSSPERLAPETRRLRSLAEAEGRDPERLTVAHIDGVIFAESGSAAEGATLVGSTDEILDGLHRYAEAGLDHLVAGISQAGDASYAGAVGALERAAAELLPTARTL